MATDVKPNNTIYINNLNEKVKKEGEFVREKLCWTDGSPAPAAGQS